MCRGFFPVLSFVEFVLFSLSIRSDVPHRCGPERRFFPLDQGLRPCIHAKFVVSFVGAWGMGTGRAKLVGWRNEPQSGGFLSSGFELGCGREGLAHEAALVQSGGTATIGGDFWPELGGCPA